MTRSDILSIFCLFSLIGLVIGACESDLARRVSKYEKTRDYQSARELLQRTVRNNPDHAEAQFLLGRLQMRQGEYEKGVSAFKKSRESSARFVEKIDFLTEKYAHQEFKEGKKAIESGSPKVAIQHFRNVTRIQPSNATAFRALGNALVQAERSKQAETAYKKSLKLEPNTETLNNLSALTFQRGAYVETIKYSQRALELLNRSGEKTASGTKSEIVQRLAYAYLQAGQFSKAREWFDEALRMSPPTEFRQDYAYALYNHEKYEDALPHLKQLSTGKKNTDTVLHALGGSYLSLGRDQEAADVYRRLHERSPNDEDALQSLIVAYQRLGENEKAEKYYERLEKLISEKNK